MTDTAPHSTVDVASRHAVHSFEWADNTARDAHTYTAADRGKIALVFSPLKFFIITAVSSGVASFLEMGAGAVSSVFFRSGAVTAQSGDYTAAQVGAPPTSRLITAGSGLSGGGDLSADRTLAVAFGSSGSTACAGNDSRLSDSRAPTSHATSHKSGGSDAVKLDELAAPTDVTTLNASSSAHGLMPKADGNAAHFYCSDGTQKSPGNLGVVWHSDVPPSSPHSLNDEFAGSNGSALDASWIDVNPGSATNTYNINGRGQIECSQNSHSGVKIAGKGKAVPGTEFAFATKLTFLIPTAAATFKAGLWVADATPANMVWINLQATALATGFVVALQSEADFVGTSLSNIVTPFVPGGNATRGGYLKIRVNGNSVKLDWGEAVNGTVSWTNLCATTIGWTMGKFGFAIDNGGTGQNDQIAFFDFFRVWSGAGSSAPNASPLGGYL